MKINNLKLKISYLTICLLGYLFIAQTTNATPLNLAIDPPIITIKAIPPAIITVPLSIQNKGDTQVTLKIQFKPFEAKGENGELEYASKTLEIFKNTQILDADVSVESITLSPKQQKKLSLNINVLQDINISDYYFSIIFVSADSSQIKSNSSINQIGIATNVLLSVGQKEIPKTALEEFSANPFFTKGPVPFTIKVKNAGIHFIEPKGEITIKNMFGQFIGKLDLTSVNVLSNSIRAIPNDVYMQELRIKSNFDSKTKNLYDFKRPIVLWKENFLLGFYTATLNISMSDEGPISTRTIHFFSFPFQALITIVIIAITIIVVRNRLKLYMNKNRT